MNPDISARLSELRKAKGVSQRKAAADFGISQALLSHYENNIREPGLEFIISACEYYGVSADYILGRSGREDKRSPESEEFLDIVDNLETEGEEAAAMLLVFLKTAEEIGNADAFGAAADCVSMYIYKLMQYGTVTQELAEKVSLCDMAVKAAETELLRKAQGRKKITASKYTNKLLREYPEIYSRFERMERLAEKRLERYE